MIDAAISALKDEIARERDEISAARAELAQKDAELRTREVRLNRMERSLQTATASLNGEAPKRREYRAGNKKRVSVETAVRWLRPVQAAYTPGVEFTAAEALTHMNLIGDISDRNAQAVLATGRELDFVRLVRWDNNPGARGKGWHVYTMTGTLPQETDDVA